MRIIGIEEGKAVEGKSSRTDRRRLERFPISLELRYREISRRSDAAQGVGKTVNISGKGIVFTVQQPMEAGTRVELTINWPVLLDGRTGLRLSVQGMVVRSTQDRVAILLQRHEFRTHRVM